MYKKIIDWLQKPYMAYTIGLHNVPLIIGSGVFIFLFLYIFEPFKIYTITDSTYKLSLILGYTIVPPISVFIMIEVCGRIFPHIYKEKNWTIGSEILFVNGLIFLIAVGNFINSVLHKSDIITPTLHSFLTMWVYSAIISFFPAMAFIWFRYYRLTIYYSKPAKIIVEDATEIIKSENISVKKPENVLSELVLIAENGNDKIILDPQQIYYIEADDNYVVIVYHSKGRVKKDLLRSSLGRIENQINSTHIRRCHRSYMVNLQKVYRVTGNAQGYKLHLLDVKEPLPVSRTYTKQIIQHT